MAKLRFKTAGIETDLIELKAGVTRFGRSPESDVQLKHQTVSTTHCEVLLGCGEVTVRDCGSTNGTFLNGVPVGEARLEAGQTLRLGDVELVVVDTEVPISIPRFEMTVVPTPPVVLADGRITCRLHANSPAAYRCDHCHELLCSDCVHRLRRRGGKLLCLCPRCSYPVSPLGSHPKKKKNLFSRLRETTRMLFSRPTAQV